MLSQLRSAARPSRTKPDVPARMEIGNDGALYSVPLLRPLLVSLFDLSVVPPSVYAVLPPQTRNDYLERHIGSRSSFTCLYLTHVLNTKDKSEVTSIEPFVCFTSHISLAKNWSFALSNHLNIALILTFSVGFSAKTRCSPQS
jgi:hypothetical protein